MSKNKFGLKGESLVAENLGKLDIKFWWNPNQRNYFGADFITEYGTIDVKIANPQNGSWKFNCHHHGKKQHNIDFFVFIIMEYIEIPLYFIFPKEKIKGLNFVISERQLKHEKYIYYLDYWDVILTYPLQKEKLIRYQKSIIKKQKGSMKKMIRKFLRDKIRDVYRTQDRCAYTIGINSTVLSRIINCTLDPTYEQLRLLCKHLEVSEREINKKDD